MTYDLIALDMDGTALDDHKVITPVTRQAIKEALSAGKEVVFCTGRGYDEMRELLGLFPEMHYMIGESGALLLDLQENKVLSRISFPEDVIGVLEEIRKGRDLITAVMSEGRLMMNRHEIDRLPEYGMTDYAEVLPKVATLSEDVLGEAARGVYPAEKINFFHRTQEDRLVSLQAMRERKLAAEYLPTENTAIECSPKGVSKASGLEMLSKVLRIPTERMIMVGDGENDRAALEYAGLAVAMGNALPSVRRICSVVVRDNNHDGCAEAIRRYLLGQKEG